MLREAQALARLSHPNVVQIYEVGEHDSEVFLAMEFVTGKTLAQWLECERSKETIDLGVIVEVFVAAGRGLAAAHQVGVLHRDFKPSNVLVGEDGRVCVLDFGLAASVSAEKGGALAVTAEAPTSQAFTTELTQAGTIIGTPAYMAPEQLAGAETDVRADIFAFCVALYEAVLGVRPFTGTSVTELLENIHVGTQKLKLGRKTAWLIPILERGLAADPGDRWQSMEALLEALGNDPTHRRSRYWLDSSILFVCTLIIAGFIAYPLVRQRACDKRAAVISAFWNSDVRGQLERGFLISGSPHASATWRQVEGRLDVWEEQWRAEQVETCLATDPPEVSAARMSCLQNHLWQFEGLLDTFAGVDGELVNRAVNAVVALPSISNCHNLYWLYGSSNDDTAGDPIDTELSRTLAKMQIALSAGLHQHIVTEVEPILPQLAKRPRLRAEALYLLGSAYRRSGDHEKALSLIQDAYHLAGKIGNDRLAAEAAVVLMAITGADLDRRTDALNWGEDAEMMIERAGLQGQEVEGKLLVNRAVLERHAGNFDEAARYLLDARRVTEAALGPRHPSIARILSNYANVLIETKKTEQALVQLRKGLALFIESYGPEHPDVAVFYTNLGVVLINEDRVEEGVHALREALEADRTNLGPDHPAVGVSLYNIGTTLDEAGDLDGAEELYEQALTILKNALGPKHTEVATVSTSYGWLLARQGVFSRAEELLEQALEVRQPLRESTGYLAITEIYMAQTLWLQDHEDARALRLATKAIRVLKKSDEVGHNTFSNFERWSRIHLSETVRNALHQGADVD